MLELLKNLCSIDGTSGDEGAVRDFIISKIDGFCDWRTDNLGNIIVFKKGKKSAPFKLMIDAHTDEVGLIVTSITSTGFLKFKTVGGIETSSLMFRRVRLGNIYGVISGKPVHLVSGEEGKKLPKADTLYIDIGASSKEEALKLVNPGDRAVVCGEFYTVGDKVISKAIDDRVGCAVLIDLIRSDSEYDFYGSFSAQEEIGLRGAKTAAFGIDPKYAIVLEGTTAADIAGVPDEKRVCKLGNGVAVSFMDGATVYDRPLYNAALNSGISAQPKCAVAGGNDSGAVHLSREGVRTIALSVPCRYIHSESSVADKRDIYALRELAEYMKNYILSGGAE